MKDILEKHIETPASVEETAISKSSQLPHRFYMYETFQKLIEGAVETGEDSTNPFKEQLRDLLQEQLDEALISIITEMGKDDCLVAEA